MAPHADSERYAADTTSKKTTTTIPSRLFCTSNLPPLAKLQSLCERTTSPSDYPLASTIQKNIPIYDLSSLPSGTSTSSLQDEWYHILLHGPGVLVLRNMYPSAPLLARANTALTSIISREGSQNTSKGDHFAANGKNDRIWNSFSKHCLQDPASFLEYYSNPWLAAICTAWLGPGYRITAQTNVVKPGGAAQVCHRDYHLGFQSADGCARIPRAMQVASQLLTLQGAVAHTDMPVVSGPTRFLPYSQLLEEGYLAYRTPEVNDYFLANYISLPLSLGDGVFFNPALMHAAGQNTTLDFPRSANLLQVSSAFGKPMETIDSIPLVEACWDLLRQKYEKEGYSGEVEAFVAAVGEGYPFPTNLDRRPPAMDGMAPEDEQGFLKRALVGGLVVGEVVEGLRRMREDSLA